jgi:hypothetical protein
VKEIASNKNLSVDEIKGELTTFIYANFDSRMTDTLA